MSKKKTKFMYVENFIENFKVSVQDKIKLVQPIEK